MSSAFDHPLVSQRYFFPRRDPLPETFWVECNDQRLACYRHLHRGDGLTVVHFHGNGEVAADYLGPVLEALTGFGVGVVLAEYRGYGRSSGTPALDGMLDDAEALVEFLGVPAQRLVLFGRSVGSIYAIHAASKRPDVAGLILESGIADPLERVLLRVHPAEIGVTRDELERAARDRLDHRAKLQRYPGPLLVMHAADDSLIPADNAVRLAEWAAGPTRLRVFDRGDHNAIMAVNWASYWHEVGEFIGGL
jgi:pimeloyl-ACP methyl ester carboxylesterase